MKKSKKKQFAAAIENRLPQIKEAAREKKEGAKIRPPALVIKLMEGKTFAEVTGVIRYKMKPEDNRT